MEFLLTNFVTMVDRSNLGWKLVFKFFIHRTNAFEMFPLLKMISIITNSFSNSLIIMANTDVFLKDSVLKKKHCCWTQEH